MERTLPALREFDWSGDRRFLWFLVAWGAANVLVLVAFPRLLGATPYGETDWGNLAGLDLTQPYATPWFRWAPPAGWLWATLIVPVGMAGWMVAHVAALGLLRDWRMALIVALSVPFWADTLNGNTLTFAFVAAWLALRGSRSGTVVFIVLAVLMPRPLMLPTLAWVVWHDRRYLPVLIGVGVAVVGLSLAAGQMDDFATRLLDSRDQLMNRWNLAPSAIVGQAWVPISLALAALLTIRGHIGLASLFAQPYWFGYYLLFGLLRRPHQHSSAPYHA